MLSFLHEDLMYYVNFDNTLQEVHNLAYFYHWGYEECISLPSTLRRVFNEKIRKQLKEESNGGNSSSNPSNSY